MEIDQAISERFALLGGLLNERMRRLVAAAEALSIGRGGVSKVARLTVSTVRIVDGLIGGIFLGG